MAPSFSPPDFGTLGLRHEVNVFVFRSGERGLEYLLLQPAPRYEAVWRPVVHPVRLDEDLHRAAVRAVRAETGLDRAFDLVSPGAGLLQSIGDLQVVDWPFGFQVRDARVAVRRRPSLAAVSWHVFDDALRSLAVDVHRQNLLQLHARLLAA
ncbi:MAG: hypothetical protein EYC70_00610 [Planctomycetota bacterium]|nr:MAG: hypothetical protein EYC70_00610 [Planctomycetota bacterium]